MTKSGIKLFCPKIIKLDGILRDIGTAALKDTGTTVLINPMAKTPDAEIILLGKQAKLLRDKESLLYKLLQYLLKAFETDLRPEIKVQTDTVPSVEEVFLSLLLGLWHLTDNNIEEVNNLHHLIEEASRRYQLDHQILATGFQGGMRIDQYPLSSKGIRIDLPKDFKWLLVDKKYISPSLLYPKDQKPNTAGERIQMASFLHGSLYHSIEQIQFGLSGLNSINGSVDIIGSGAVQGTNLFYAVFKNSTDVDQFIEVEILGKSDKLPKSLKISNLSLEGVRLL